MSLHIDVRKLDIEQPYNITDGMPTVDDANMFINKYIGDPTAHFTYGLYLNALYKQKKNVSNHQSPQAPKLSPKHPQWQPQCKA